MKATTHGPLTPAKIDALKPRDERYEVKDSAAPGLQLRVTPNGVKSFRLPVRDPKQRWITLGRWSLSPAPGCLTLTQARDWLERLKEGRRVNRLADVEAELTAQMEPRPATLPDGALTVRELAKDFLANLDRKRPEQAERPIEKDILPAIGDRPVGAVTPLHCRRIVESVVARGSPTQAGHVLAVLKQLFTFAVDRADIEASPAERFKNPRALGVVKNMSQRFLSGTEIAAFWKALDSYRGMTPTTRNGLKLLLLTGVRSGELLQARIADLDLAARAWTVPVAHQKLTRDRERTARPWVVPLARTALTLFEELAALAKSLGSAHVMASFHAAGAGSPITEKALNHAMRRLFEGKQPLLKFEGERPTPHDLRRTLRTGLGDLGVPFHIAERSLNHSLGKISTTYDVGDYLPERRAALEKWDAHVARITAEP